MPAPLFKKGRIKTGGKVKGSKNKSTILREQAELEARIRLEVAKLATPEELDAAIAEMNTLQPLQILLAAATLKLRRGDVDGAVAVAEKAVEFTAPKLAATDVRIQVSQRSDAEVAQEIEALRAKIERSRSAPPLIEATAEPAEPVKVHTVQE